MTTTALIQLAQEQLHDTGVITTDIALALSASGVFIQDLGVSHESLEYFNLSTEEN